MLDRNHFDRLGLTGVYDRVMAGSRLSFTDGAQLFACPDILAVGSLAFAVRQRLHGDKAHFVRNRQINYSNICGMGCRFCSFARAEGSEGAFVLGREEILSRLLDDGGEPYAEVHVVGGCHPTLSLDWFEATFREIKRLRPHTVLKAFTVTEVLHLARMAGVSTAEAFARLGAAGVDMITGGGAEIFHPEIRTRICPEKISGDDYLRLSGEAHAAGLPSNCTMLFGHVEDHAHRLDHLLRLREQQDKSGGYTCFIPLAFQDRNNPLAEEKAARLGHRAAGPELALDRLRTIAVSRLMLDNIPHIKAYWVMLGVKLAQAALYFGADDLDGTIEEEHIGRMAGAASDTTFSRSALETMIRLSGFRPVERDALFRELPGRQAGPDKPLPPAGTKAACLVQAETCAPCASVPGEAGTMAAAPEVPEQSVAAHCGTGSGRVRAILRRAAEGERLGSEEAALLYREAELFDLGAAAHAARLRLHPQPIVTYVADRNINYSNICVCACRFCAFYRAPGQTGGYVLSREDLDAKIRETVELGGTQILLQGGHHPDLPFSFYTDLVSWIRERHPGIHIHAFSPPEIAFFAEQYGMDHATIIAALREAGLHSIPGGGAEILTNRARSLASPNKCSADVWLDVMRQAHKQGLFTTATMMFGHAEDEDERLEHLFRVRDLQDQTHGFTAFIPWTFQPANTAMAHLPTQPSPVYLRVLALSRLVLDNLPNIQASWVTMGPEIAQLALFFGANDFGSLMIEENVVAAANVSYRMDRAAIHRVIATAGFTPRQRLMDYRLVEEAP